MAEMYTEAAASAQYKQLVEHHMMQSQAGRNQLLQQYANLGTAGSHKEGALPKEGYKMEVGQLYEYRDGDKTLLLKCVNNGSPGYQSVLTVLESTKPSSNPIGGNFYGPLYGSYDSSYKLIKKENKMKEILKDIGSFVKEHRSVIYTVVFIALLDHLVLGGKFREKLKDLVERALTKAHKSLEDKTNL